MTRHEPWEDSEEAQSRQRVSLHREKQNYSGFLRLVPTNGFSPTYTRKTIYVDIGIFVERNEITQLCL